MTAPLRFLVAVAASLLVAGCGGGDDDSGSSSKADSKPDRSGYFDEAESDAINPALTDFNEATADFDTRHIACGKEADRLFKAGKDPRTTVQCHLDQTQGIVDAVEGVDDVLADIDADELRKACASQPDDARSFLATFAGAWKTVHADWERYADGKDVDNDAVDAHLSAAAKQTTEFVGPVLGDLTTACYTKADRETAKDEADTDPATAEPDDADA